MNAGNIAVSYIPYHKVSSNVRTAILENFVTALGKNVELSVRHIKEGFGERNTKATHER